ncbi:hypothetical protein JOF29_002053 [Kribbella aluminosa]|uniref:Uncharacterized protein n=1 Tax=Kribbella aluminosa TaxID=416017 RepID=A0ABS4UH67_9ACTN|nr:hypothetical protein [Kribbella aluminosa]
MSATVLNPDLSRSRSCSAAIHRVQSSPPITFTVWAISSSVATSIPTSCSTGAPSSNARLFVVCGAPIAFSADW